MSGEESGDGRQVDWWSFLGPLAGAVLGVGVTLVILDLQGVLDPPAPPPVSEAVVVQAAAPTPTSVASVEPAEVVDLIQVAETAVPSIVTVVTAGRQPSTGSGVVYSPDGYVVTNHHVIDLAESFRIEFADGLSYEATLVGSDPLTDLAVLQVTRDDVVPLPLASLADLRIGQPAIAVGNPLGLSGGPSVTVGIISALDRTLAVDGADILYGLIQTDAPITRGSSGGALVDGRGRLLGITTAIGVSDVGAEGLGFAIPVDLVENVVADLIDDGLVRHAKLGIQGRTAEEVRESGATVRVGAAVTRMEDDSAMAAAGGALGDVIVALDGRRVTSIDQLISRLRHHRAGEQVSVTVLREGDEMNLVVTLGLHT